MFFYFKKSIRKIFYVPARVREVFRVGAAEKAPWGGDGKPPGTYIRYSYVLRNIF